MAEKMCSKCGQDKAIQPYFFSDGDLCYNCYFEKRNFVILSDDWPLIYFCKKHPNKILKTSHYDVRVENKPPSCPTCNYEEGAIKRFDKKASTSNITLRQHLRNISTDWRKDSMKKDNHCCRITGAGIFLEVHHPTAFDDLYNIFKSKMGLKNRLWDYELREFNSDTRRQIRGAWKNIIYDHGLGITLARSIHKLFHGNYGKKDILHENIIEFEKNLFNGGYSTKFSIYRNKWLSEGICANLIDTFSTTKYIVDGKIN